MGNSTYDRLGVDTDGDGYSDPDAGWPARTGVTERMPSRVIRHNGAMKTTTVLEATLMVTMQMIAPTRQDRPRKTNTDVLTETGMVIRTQAIRSRTTGRNGKTRTVTTTVTTPMETTLTSSPTMPRNGDADGDGYGDNPGGTNGDRFPTDPTQWSDADNDGYGDNFVDTDGDGVSEGNSDVCPQTYGESNSATSRGCPDSDGDGFTDPEDAFPDQPLQWADQDGDGFGDNVQFTDGDECIDVYGKSTENGVQGCPDSDGDGHADPFGDFVAKPDYRC